MLCFGSGVRNMAGSRSRNQSPAFPHPVTRAARRQLAKHAPVIAAVLLALIGVVEGLVLARLSRSPGLPGHAVGGKAAGSSVSFSHETQRTDAGVRVGSRP
jgi:hypothetical protein